MNKIKWHDLTNNTALQSNHPVEHRRFLQMLRWVKQLIGMTAWGVYDCSGHHPSRQPLLAVSFFQDELLAQQEIARETTFIYHIYHFKYAGRDIVQAQWMETLPSCMIWTCKFLKECFKLDASNLRRQAQKDFIACGLAWELPFQASLILPRTEPETNLQCVA